MDRIPIQGQIEITNICNFKCVHCYIINSKNQEPVFLSYEVIKSVIDEASEMGCKTITITGGECMLHPDFEKIYTYIWKKGIKLNILTNASLITEEIVSMFKKMPPESVEVSLYGATEETYKEVTKHCKLKDVIKGLGLLQKNVITLQIKVIVLKQNEHELEEMKKLGCKYTSKPLRVSYDLMPAYDFSLDVLDNRSHIQKSATLNKTPRTSKMAFNCHAGSSFFCIDHAGNVTMCSFCSFSKKNLKDYSFRDIWNSFEKDIKLSIPKDSECYNCEFLPECINCPGRTWMFNKKVGLYPLSQCKKKIKEVLMEQESKKFLPGTFTIINDIVYFRLENGNVAVEKPRKITIKSSEDDIVELVTVTKKDDKGQERKENFWKVDNKIFALATSSCYIIPEDITFVDCYISENYPDGLYVKYMSSGKFGIIYVSEVHVTHIISYVEGYTKISFEKNMFYAEKGGKNKEYYVINESGKVYGPFSTKCKKVEGYMLFYDDSSIFVNASKFDIPGGVSSVEIIKEKNMTFVRIVNNNGIYYYSDRMKYLLGPISEDEISSNTYERGCCFIYEKVKNKIVQVFYIRGSEDPYVCNKKLSSKKGIKCYRFSTNQGYRNFFVADKIVYIFEDENFIPLVEVEGASKYDIIPQNETNWNREYTIIAYQRTKPIYLAHYVPSQHGIISEGNLEKIADGHGDENIGKAHICNFYKRIPKGKKKNSDEYKTEKYILVISEKKGIILDTKGDSCHLKMVGDDLCYVVEDGDSIRIYKTNGRQRC